MRQSADDSITPEAVRDNWAEITDFTDPLYPKGSVSIFDVIFNEFEFDSKCQHSTLFQEASMLLGKVLQDLWAKDEANKSTNPNASPVVYFNHSHNSFDYFHIIDYFDII